MELRNFLDLIDTNTSYVVAWYDSYGNENIVSRSWLDEDDDIPEKYMKQDVEGIWFDRNQDSLMIMIWGDDD